MPGGVVSALRGRFDQRGLRWVNRVSRVVIAAFGVLAFARRAGEGS